MCHLSGQRIAPDHGQPNLLIARVFSLKAIIPLLRRDSRLLQQALAVRASETTQHALPPSPCTPRFTAVCMSSLNYFSAAAAVVIREKKIVRRLSAKCYVWEENGYPVRSGAVRAEPVDYSSSTPAAPPAPPLRSIMSCCRCQASARNTATTMTWSMLSWCSECKVSAGAKVFVSGRHRRR